MKRHKPPGEETAAQVFERLGWMRDQGYWVKDGLKFSVGIAERLWEEQGPRKLELLVREKGG